MTSLLFSPPVGARLLRGHPINRGLVGCWLLNEGGGQIFKDIAGVNDGSGVGGPISSPGIYGNAVKCNGSSQYVTLPAFNKTFASATITGWFNSVPNNNSYIGGVYSRGSNGGPGMGFGYASGGAKQLGYQWGLTDYAWNSGLFLPDNLWTFVALAVSPSGAIMYMNLQSASNTLSEPPITFNGSMEIGTDASALATRSFNGLINNVRFYDRALPAQEIAQLYAQPFAGLAMPARRSYSAPASSSIVFRRTLSAQGARVGSRQSM